MGSENGEEGHASRDSASVRAQLDRILESAEFQVPERGRRFLRYIVEETLEGRTEQLKACRIAHAVFGRDASFDAQNNPVVRIEAGRIRRALERYYLVCGRNDPIRITIPKGGYAPRFLVGEKRCIAGEAAAQQDSENMRRQTGPTTYRDLLLPIGLPVLLGIMAVLAVIRPLESYFLPPEPSPATAASTLTSRVTILVEPFVAVGGTAHADDLARELTDQLIGNLSKVENIVVSNSNHPGTETAGLLFNIQGSALVEGEVVHLHVRLIDGADGAVVWAKQYDREQRNQIVLDIEHEIAAQVAMEISNSRKLSDAGTDP
ncbi:hypothetical protein AM571_CH03648 [Rhizobium etli 8C-3]|uniref:TolB-like protein n=1 Tax=Rhizobium etli 8C-3 TaxID=538025 RepID=A0A1L5P8D9_RHIET|nr:hypothetical protein [Rhizobium etli]APO76439.1 hypothetical protein AM571_CH03648 [Rhizobium etli 8C-3]